MKNLFEGNSTPENRPEVPGDIDTKLAALRKAVFDTGRMPDLHNQIMMQHRREWPVLWDAIDDLIGGVYHESK